MFTIVVSVLLADVQSKKKIGILKKILVANSLKIRNNDLIIVSNYKVYHYELNGENIRFVKSFGKKGEGPGEFKTIPEIILNSKNIITYTPYKIIFFDFNGKLKKEIRMKNNGIYLLSNSIIVESLDMIKKGFDVKCFDLSGKYKSYISFIRTPVSIIDSGQEHVFDLLCGESLLDVSKDNIFIIKDSRNFVISVYNSKGKKLYDISKGYKKIKVSDKIKKIYIKRFKKEKKQMLNIMRKINIKVKFAFPEYFPAISYFFVRGNDLIVKTYEKKGDKYKWLILDKKGKSKNALYLSDKIKDTLIDYDNHRFYYLLFNEDSDYYELYTEKNSGN